MDLDDAILNVEKIKTQGVYSLVAHLKMFLLLQQFQRLVPKLIIQKL
jgi:hypothetical protein